MEIPWCWEREWKESIGLGFKRHWLGAHCLALIWLCRSDWKKAGTAFDAANRINSAHPDYFATALTVKLKVPGTGTCRVHMA